MNKPEINLSSIANLSLGGMRVDRADFTVQNSSLLGMVAVFPDRLPPVARVFMANTGEVFEKTFKDRQEASRATEPHHIVEIIREGVDASNIASAIIALANQRV